MKIKKILNKKIEMNVYANFLKYLEIRDGALFPNEVAQLRLREAAIDYDLVNEIQDLYRLGEYSTASQQSVDMMLTQNDPMIVIRGALRGATESLASIELTKVHEFIDELNVGKLKQGGVLSKIPLFGVLYSYDVHCFAARLSIYMEDVVSNQQDVKYHYKKLQGHKAEMLLLKKKLRSGLNSLLSAALGYESVLFNSLGGNNVGAWVCKRTTVASVDVFNNLIDCSNDIYHFIKLMDDADNLIANALEVIEVGTNTVYNHGVYPIARAFEGISNKEVTVQNSGQVDSFIESKGDGGEIVVYLDPLSEKFKDIQSGVGEVDAMIDSLFAELKSVLNSLKEIKLSKVDL